MRGVTRLEIASTINHFVINSAFQASASSGVRQGYNSAVRSEAARSPRNRLAVKCLVQLLGMVALKTFSS